MSVEVAGEYMEVIGGFVRYGYSCGVPVLHTTVQCTYLNLHSSINTQKCLFNRAIKTDKWATNIRTSFNSL